MYILKCISGFKVCCDVQYVCFFKAGAFVHVNV